MKRFCLFLTLPLCVGMLVPLAQGQGKKGEVKRIPPAGVAIPQTERTALTEDKNKLGEEIEELKNTLQGKWQDLIADVQIYYNAAHYALIYDEFFNAKETATARKLLKEGHDRVAALREGKAPWATQTGLLARGYVSQIDDSVQPYGLVVPPSYTANSGKKWRLDLWYHGRGETLNEISFINGRETQKGDFTPQDTIVLHLYGRYCNANHFAGEIDTLEALADVKRKYPIDENRILVRGFSMGGASTYNFAVHYTDLWAAAAPGAGFSESIRFLNLKVNNLPDYEKKLLHMYDCVDWAANMSQLPMIAYSGEIDGQKLAADLMEKAMAKEGLKLVHIIGPNTAHMYEKNAKVEVARLVDELAAKGRDPFPKTIRMVTYTLRYPKMYWVTVEGMTRHWEEARVEAEIADANTIKVTTKNVEAISLNLPPGSSLDAGQRMAIVIDGNSVTGSAVKEDKSLTAHLQKRPNGWALVNSFDAEGDLRKQPSLQGPIDDAFMDRFIMVRPTSKGFSDKVDQWTKTEMEHATVHWRRQFRGEALQKDDAVITDAEIASANLVLWGDPASNKVLAKIIDKLPLKWTAEKLEFGTKSFSDDHHTVALIFPNPLNPKKYVVLNSGFTFREFDYLNNARQIPKLGDYAIYDVSIAPDAYHAAGVESSGFFDEHWKMKD